jgi:REP element-mobilizing transposase RayT
MRKRSARQLGLVFRSHGGARAGAGRPPNGASAGVPHVQRPSLSPRHPVHVTLRVTRSVPTLRGRKMYQTIERSLASARERFGFCLVHFSVQRDHLHLLAEVPGPRALSRGIQGLSIRVAKAVNRRLGRRGSVFADRYHARALKTPREVRHALRYVLLNARKHERDSSRIPAGFVDPCSSAPWFDGWRRPSELAFVAGVSPRSLDPPVISARTWLLRVGWRRAGPIDVDDLIGGAELLFRDGQAPGRHS